MTEVLYTALKNTVYDYKIIPYSIKTQNEDITQKFILKNTLSKTTP